ncbi:MAG TPA: hypothetical protein VIC35_08380 [Acidimicrobiia bacterium]|jgi:hypothetical protein
MDRFLVEIPHDSDKTSCLAAIKVFAESGSHYLTHADFGCEDGVHDAWLIVEADSHNEARMVAPPQFRERTRVTKLKRYAWTGGDDPHAAL